MDASSWQRAHSPRGYRRAPERTTLKSHPALRWLSLLFWAWRTYGVIPETWRDRNKSRKGVVANTPNALREGAVGFIDWLDGRDSNYGRGRGVGRALGLGTILGVGVAVAVGVLDLFASGAVGFIDWLGAAVIGRETLHGHKANAVNALLRASD